MIKVKKSKYRLKFIDSYRFMSCKLSDLVDKLSGIKNKKCKSCMEEKNIKLECNYIGFKNNRSHYKCRERKTRYTKSINDAIKNFPILYQF